MQSSKEDELFSRFINEFRILVEISSFPFLCLSNVSSL